MYLLYNAVKTYNAMTNAKILTTISTTPSRKKITR